MKGWWLAVASILLAFARTAAAATESTDIPTAEVPAWVLVPPRERPPADDGKDHGGVVNDLVDDQYRVGGTVEHYTHRVVRITSAAGVDDVGQIDIDYEPDYQRLRFHRFRLLRAGESIDALKTATVRVAAEETNLDERVYNGTMTAHVLLHDLRVGDVVDYDYSIEGLNPVLGGRFAARVPLARSRPVSFLRVRILMPESRSLSFRAAGGEPMMHTSGGTKELLWERRDVPEVVFEKDAPEWYSPMPMLSLSELASWHDVASWAAPLFDEASRPDAAIEAAARDIAQKQPSRDAQALAALRFVQDQVRYLGIEIGANSHRPHAASQVLNQRFGDCKDKSALLVALLHALGVEASPVLVNTRLGEHLDEELPSPYAFNHAIVRIHLDGRDLWVDPTRTAEHGPLAKAPVRYGRALVAVAGSNELTAIPAAAPAEPTWLVKETYAVGERDATLEVVRTFRDDHARFVRQRIAESSRAELQKHYLQDYTGMYPSIEPKGEMAIEDHEAEDVTVLREHYLIRDARKNGRFSVRAAAVVQAIGRASAAQRTAPLGLEHPLFVRHEIEIGLEGSYFSEAPDENFHDGSLTVTVRGDAREGKSVLRYEVRSHRDFVPTSELTTHANMVDSILDACHYSFGEETHVRREGRHALTLFAAIGALFGIVGVIAVGRFGVLSFGAWLRSRRRRPHTKEPASRRSGNGETAATAAAAASHEDAAKSLARARCSCGARFQGPVPQVAWAMVTFAEETVHVARMICPACGTAYVRYFDIEQAP